MPPNQCLSNLHGEIFTDPNTLKKYSRDASLFEITPRAIIFPKNSEDIKNLVKLTADCCSEKLSLTARAAGTDMTGGPLSNSLIIDFTRHFNLIKRINSDKNEVVAQPGVYYRDLEKELQKRNLLLPPYPASKDLCALGGMIANNAGGEKTLAYGKMADYVKELKIVLSDGEEYSVKPLNRAELDAKLRQKNFEGEIYRQMRDLLVENRSLIEKARPQVSKNSAGYALWKIWNGVTFNLIPLFVGSQGTLGIITEAKLKLIKPKKHSRLLVIFLNNSQPLAEVVDKILKRHPESFEIFDDHSLKLGIKHFFWTLAFYFLPEALLLLKNKLKIPRFILLAEFTADSLTVAKKQAQNAQKAIAHLKIPARITRYGIDTQKYWAIRRESFNLLRKELNGKKTAPFIDDLIILPKYLSQFLPQLEQILKKYSQGIDINYTIAGHIGNGNLHIIPLANLANKKVRNLIPILMKEVYGLVFKFHGSMTAEHNDGLIRTPFLEQMFGSKIYRLFQETKRIFDPDNIFNPNKKVGGSLENSLKHLKQKNN